MSCCPSFAVQSQGTLELSFKDFRDGSHGPYFITGCCWCCLCCPSEYLKCCYRVDRHGEISYDMQALFNSRRLRKHYKLTFSNHSYINPDTRLYQCRVRYPLRNPQFAVSIHWALKRKQIVVSEFMQKDCLCYRLHLFSLTFGSLIMSMAMHCASILRFINFLKVYRKSDYPYIVYPSLILTIFVVATIPLLYAIVFQRTFTDTLASQTDTDIADICTRMAGHEILYTSMQRTPADVDTYSLIRYFYGLPRNRRRCHKFWSLFSLLLVIWYPFAAISRSITLFTRSVQFVLPDTYDLQQDLNFFIVRPLLDKYLPIVADIARDVSRYTTGVEPHPYLFDSNDYNRLRSVVFHLMNGLTADMLHRSSPNSVWSDSLSEQQLLAFRDDYINNRCLYTYLWDNRQLKCEHISDDSFDFRSEVGSLYDRFHKILNPLSGLRVVLLSMFLLIIVTIHYYALVWFHYLNGTIFHNGHNFHIPLSIAAEILLFISVISYLYFRYMRSNLMEKSFLTKNDRFWMDPTLFKYIKAAMIDAENDDEFVAFILSSFCHWIDNYVTNYIGGKYTRYYLTTHWKEICENWENSGDNSFALLQLTTTAASQSEILPIEIVDIIIDYMIAIDFDLMHQSLDQSTAFEYNIETMHRKVEICGQYCIVDRIRRYNEWCESQSFNDESVELKVDISNSNLRNSNSVMIPFIDESSFFQMAPSHSRR